ncbi:sucrose-phosphate synthase 4-like [Miscanthus floridulus]|uniref:sucrose-phosphate synthase 4-like n=1 Tax=Miscanthus floridulus TaxID=154761 RepID=UPI00345B2A89
MPCFLSSARLLLEAGKEELHAALESGTAAAAAPARRSRGGDHGGGERVDQRVPGGDPGRGQRQGQGHVSAAPPLTTAALPRLLAEAGGQGAAAYGPTRYFVEEVVSRFDDRDLHKTWTKVVAMRNSQERSNRLENLCWRSWHVARKKQQVEWEYSRQLALRRLEQEQGSREAAEELSVSEGETKADAAQAQQPLSVARIGSEARIASDDDGKDDRNPYIVLISIHGLVRGENMELGRDSDAGG